MFIEQLKGLQGCLSRAATDIFTILYENENNLSLSIAPVMAAKAALFGTEISCIYFGKKYFSEQSEKTHLVAQITLPLIVQLGIYFFVSKVRHSSYKLWLTTIGIQSLTYALRLITEYNLKPLRYNIKQIKTNRTNDSNNQSRLNENETKHKVILSVYLSLEILATLGLSFAQNERTPSSNYQLSLISTSASILIKSFAAADKVLDINKFLAAPILGMGTGYFMHYMCKKINPGRLAQPFPWKIELVQHGINTLVDLPFYLNKTIYNFLDPFEYFISRWPV